MSKCMLIAWLILTSGPGQLTLYDSQTVAKKRKASLKGQREGSDRLKAVEAPGLLLQVKDFKFLISLLVFDRILTYTKSLSDSLQSMQIDLGKATDLAMVTEGTLQDFRTDNEWEKVFTYAKKVAQLNSIEISATV